MWEVTYRVKIAWPQSHWLRRQANFRLLYIIEYLRETILACSYLAQIECFKQKHRCRKSRDTVPLRGVALSTYIFLTWKAKRLVQSTQFICEIYSIYRNINTRFYCVISVHSVSKQPHFSLITVMILDISWSPWLVCYLVWVLEITLIAPGFSLIFPWSPWLLQDLVWFFLDHRELSRI